MKISDIKTTTIRIPLRVGKRFATRTVYYRDYTIAHVHTDEGITGWGYCWGIPLVTSAIDTLLKELLINEDPLNISWLWEKMYNSTSVWGRRGVIIRAISVIDIALWDILGKVSGLPIYKLLGGYREKVKVYYSGGYYPEPYRDEAQFLKYIEKEMETYRDRGFTAFKMKVGGGPLELDLKRIEIARKVIGDSADLMVDANNAWDADTAIRVGRIFEEYNIRWLEEPVPIDDIMGCAKVAAALDTSVAIGENHFTRWEFKQIIENKAADILQGDPTLMGGITEWLKVAHLAAVNNIPLAPHWTHDLNVHAGAGIKEVIYNEYFELEGDVFNFQEVLENPIKAQDGYIEPPQSPGHGLVLNMDAVKHYTFS